ncbi:hypothetical protein H0H92_013630, partial [Tricholoma furcatifolium]
FEVQSDESLTELDAAWQAFHENKQVFIELGIREHFNISKLHNIRHYLDSIRELGSAAGFNTEATERLHIDLAKVGYRASNKKDYIKQMSIWLRRQEAVSRFSRYLEWALCQERVEAAREGSDGDQDMDDVGENEKIDSYPQTHTTCHRVAKNPAFPHVTVTTMVNDYGATDFLSHLSLFLREQAITPHAPLTPLSTFPVYRRVYMTIPTIPEVSTTSLSDQIIATKAEPQAVTLSGIRKSVPARYSTVLVRVKDGDPAKGALDGAYY